jgi:hypothetical protein
MRGDAAKEKCPEIVLVKGKQIKKDRRTQGQKDRRTERHKYRTLQRQYDLPTNNQSTEGQKSERQTEI